MFRSEVTDTRMGSGSASWIEDRTLWDGVSIIICLRPCPSGVWAKLLTPRSIWVAEALTKSSDAP